MPSVSAKSISTKPPNFKEIAIMAFALNSFNNVTSGAAASGRMYAYKTTSDTLATVLADDYFVDLGTALATDDLIQVVTSDGVGTFKVLTATSSTVVLGASMGLVHTRTTIPTASVLTLRASAYTIAPAPGVGKIDVFESALLQLDYNSAAYVETDDNMRIQYIGDAIALSDTIEATGFIDATADTTTRAIAVKDAIVANSATENKALTIANFGSGEYTTGNSPLIVDTYFYVVSAA